MMEKELLEAVLKKSWKEKSVAKVMNIDSSPAVEKYQNFLSTVTRIKLQVVLANGRVVKKSLVVKDEKVNDEFGKLVCKNYDVFRVETMMYKTVLKEMEYLMEEFNDTNDILWCNLIHDIPFSCLVLEDLKESGFTMSERTEFFDLDKILLAVTCLGRYHAMTKVMEERGLISKDSFKSWMAANDVQMQQFWIWNFNAMAQGIKQFWDPSWGSLVDRVKLNSIEDLNEKMKSLVTFDETKFNVLNHGDCNKNNFMFRHDWKNRPIAMKFVDFQIPHYNSPCCDLIVMVYGCTDAYVRRDNLKLIIETYHKSLINTLDLYRYSGSNPELDEITEGMDKFSFFGLLLFICCYPTITISEELEKYLDIPKIIASQGKEGCNLELYNSEKMEETIGPDLKTLIDRFF